MRPYSLDLRIRVLADCDAGLTFAATARKYTVSAEWVRTLYNRREQTGEIAARPPIPRRIPFHRRHETELRAAIAANPDLTLAGLRNHLGVPVSLGTLWTALRALKLSFKKKRSPRRNNTGPMSPNTASKSTTGNSKGSTRTASCSSTKPGSKPT